MGGCPAGFVQDGFRKGGRQKGGLKAAFDEEIVAEIATLVGEDAVESWDFEAIEMAARRKAMRVAACAVERRINADHSDHVGPTRPCACGAPAKYAGRRSKTFESVLGPLNLERAYYHCVACEAGLCPRDRALGLEGGSLSPGVLRMVGRVGAMVSFGEGHELLTELAGVEVSTKQVEREAERLGREIAEDEKRVVERVPDEQVPPTLYMGLDGTGVPMRAEELEGRSGKQEDGSAKTREVKLCALWTAEGRDEDGVPVRDPGSVSYSAAIESAATMDGDATPAFVLRAYREGARRGFDRAARPIILGDGAAWIWNIASSKFPRAKQIVDRYHVNEHIADAAKAIYGPGTDLAETWTHNRCLELKAGKIDAVLGALAKHPRCEVARACRDYIKKNRNRMRYDEYHAAGLCTSTGVVEGGCKYAIGTRLKRGGMFWTVSGADAIIALRCCKLSGRFEDFWERRAAQRAA